LHPPQVVHVDLPCLVTATSPLTSPPVPAKALSHVQRAPRPDALLESLLAVCKIHGVAATRDSLAAGMPIDSDGMTLATAERAAARAGLSTRLYKVALRSIDTAALPAILLLRERGACVLLGIDDQGPPSEPPGTGSARVILPQAGMAEVQMPIADLKARFAGVALFAHPKLDANTFGPDTTRQVRQGASTSRRTGPWFWSAVLAQRPIYRDVLWAAALVNLLAIALPMFTMNVYDRVVPNSAFETLWALAIGVSIALGAELILRGLRGRFVDEASARVDIELSARLMQQVLDLRLEHRPASVGAFASTLRGFESVRELIASGTVTALVDLPFGLLYLALVVWIAPWLSLPVIAGFALTVGLGAWLQQRLHRLSETSWHAASQRQAALVETIAGLETVKAQGAQGRVQSRWERANEHLAGLTVRMRAQSSSAMLGAAWITQMTTVAIVVIGVHLIGERTLTMGALIAVSMLASRALAPASQIVGLLLQYQGARAALDALNKLMAAPVERAGPDVGDGDGDGQATSTGSGQAYAARGALRGAITFDKVSFKYPGRDDVALHEASFSIAPGEAIAFIGRAGSGKSTIQRLLMGLYQPTSGSVRFDGVDSAQFDPASLRRDIASVGQDNLLFQGSLRDNVALAMPQADDADILAAAHAAGLGHFIDRHPKGLLLQVGERGEGLSGGQRQAVALARALLRGGAILCLDEPTSAMDHASESLVAGHLASHLRAGASVGVAAGGSADATARTMILSTHRRSLLALVTRVIVVDDGRIVADGPRDRVLATIEAPKAASPEPGRRAPAAAVEPAHGR
jgi:ATP-binding cassette, subfamily C, bacterial LapB